VTTQCDEACKHDTMCLLSDTSQYCRDDCPGRAAALLPDWREAYFDCYAHLYCDDTDAECQTEAAQTVELRQIDQEYFSACQPKQTECQGAFDENYCSESRYYETAQVQMATDCLDLPCDQIMLCLEAALPFGPFGA
jgi:hypothetical protein